jgi:hypothetical protein
VFPSAYARVTSVTAIKFARSRLKTVPISASTNASSGSPLSIHNASCSRITASLVCANACANTSP